MRRLLFLLVLVLALLPGAAQDAASAPDRERLVVVRIDGQLDVGSLALLHRAVATAERANAPLVIELDTPGGAVDLMWRMVAELDDALSRGVRTTAWIHDHAHSAGALVALACERVYGTPLASIGSALPVRVGVGGLMPAAEDEDVAEKLSSALRAEFRGIANERGRPGVVAEAMVDPSVEVRQIRVDGEVRLVDATEWHDLRERGVEVEFLRTVCAAGELLNVTAREGVELGLLDGVGADLEAVAAKLGAEHRELLHVERSRSEDLAGWLYRIGPLLFVLGFLFAWMEFKVPGFGLPGIMAAAAFALALFGRYLVGLADVPHLVLFVVGVIGIAVELFVLPGALWPGLAGAVALVAAAAWSILGSGVGLEYPLERELIVDELFLLAALALGGIVGAWLLGRVLPSTPLYSRLALSPSEGSGGSSAAMPQAARERTVVVGALGRAITALRPVGKVRVDLFDDHEFEALFPGGTLMPGTRVVVESVQRSGRLIVAEAGPAAEGVDR
ncbi:MAG: hypothetical protein WD226_10875 [Planctomycetota bacterium]